MNSPPTVVGGAPVIRWTVIDARHRPTGAWKHIVAGVLQRPAAGLAICRHDGEDAYYLFGCDERWNSITDSWHVTLDDALSRAEQEYEGVSKTWNVA